MAIGPIENATIARLQDFSTMKHFEDQKALQTQGHISDQIQKNTEEKPHVVQKQEGASASKNRMDENSGGSGYYGDGGKNRKKKEPTEKMVVKNNFHGFDMKI